MQINKYYYLEKIIIFDKLVIISIQYMNIFYLQEHTSCHYYAKLIDAGFRYYESDEIVGMKEGIARTNYIVFILQGKINFVSNEFSFCDSSGEMFFVSRNSTIKYQLFEGGRFMVAVFESITNLCSKTSLLELVNYKKLIKYEVKTFPINDRLFSFLEPLSIILKDGANCKQLHDIKLQELFWYFRAYYTKEALASLLYTLIGVSLEFRNKVLHNYSRASTVQELAEICGISLVSFKRQFTEEFGEPPYSWLQKRRVSLIKFRLADKDIPLKQIIDELNFSSLPHFVRFCKKNIGMTPGELRKSLICGSESAV